MAALDQPDREIDALEFTRGAVAPGRSEWLSAGEYDTLCERLATTRNDPLAAVKLGSRYSPRLAGLVGYLSFNQPNLRAALDCLSRSSEQLMRGAGVDLDVAPPMAVLSYARDEPGGRSAFDAEMKIASLVVSLREHSPDCRIHQINFVGRPAAGVSALRQFFGVRCVFDQPCDSVVFDAAALERPLAAADSQLRETLVELMGIAGIEWQQKDIISQLRAEIVRTLSDTACGVEQLAARMNMTPRTLQRHLTQHHYSFTSLRDDVRRTKAISMLEHTSLPIGEISYRVGYTEVSSFYRAFRSWTGVAPGKYRTHARNAAAPQRAALAHDVLSRAEARMATG